MKILNADEIFTLSIKVTEPIEKKYLLSFLRTAIKNSILQPLKGCCFQYYYNLPALTYEVLCYEKISDEIVLEPDLIIANSTPSDNSKNQEKIKVFVTNKYLVVTQNQQILIFKKISAIEDEEIVLYVKQIYKIEEFELIRVSDEEIDALGYTIDIDKRDKTYRLDESKSFMLFCFYSLSGFLILAMSIYFTYYTDNKSGINDTEKKVIIKNTNNKMILPDTRKLFENISIYKLEVEKINYINRTITTTLSNPTKSTLLEFATLYKKKLKIKSIKFDEIASLYIAEVSIEY